MKNEYNVLMYAKNGMASLIPDDDGGAEPKAYRSEGQANSDGRRLVNAGEITRYKVLKVVSDQV